MGSALARRLSKFNFEIYLWNRTKSKAELLAKEINAKMIVDVIEGIQKSDAVITFLADDNSLISFVSNIPRSDGLIFINSSTISPLTSEKVSRFLESRGACYVEAPVIGGPKALLEGKVISIVAGRDPCKGSAYMILNKISERIVDVGDDPRGAQALKLSFNSLLISSLELLSESIIISEAYGVSIDSFKEAFKGTVFEPFISKYIDRLLAEEREPSFRLRLAAKDLNDAVDAAKNRERSVPLISLAASMYTMAVSKNFGDMDYSRIFSFLKKKDAK